MHLELNGSWTRKVGKKRTEQASANGARRIWGRKDWVQKKVVRLILEENKGPKGSLASTLSAAVLLKRTTKHDRFVAQIQANAEGRCRIFGLSPKCDVFRARLLSMIL